MPDEIELQETEVQEINTSEDSYPNPKPDGLTEEPLVESGQENAPEER